MTIKGGGFRVTLRGGLSSRYLQGGFRGCILRMAYVRDRMQDSNEVFRAQWVVCNLEEGIFGKLCRRGMAESRGFRRDVSLFLFVIWMHLYRVFGWSVVGFVVVGFCWIEPRQSFFL